MPTRGRLDLVRRAIGSVLRQTFKDFELLILDNSPAPDKSSIREEAEKDPRIRFVDRGNIGLTKARNLGANLSRGRLLALLDSDDYWHKERLEKHVDAWRNNHIGLSWDRWAEDRGSRLRVFPEPVSQGIINPPRLAIRLFSSNFIHASAGTVSTKFARDRGFPMLDILSSDWVLFMRAAEYYPAYFIGETLSYRDTTAPERVSNSNNRRAFNKEDLAIREWALKDRPGIYGLAYTKFGVERLRRSVLRRLGKLS